MTETGFYEIREKVGGKEMGALGVQTTLIKKLIVKGSKEWDSLRGTA